MAVHFSLTPIGEDKPASLNSIDEAICEAFGQELNKYQYCFGWFPVIGYGLACGESWEEVDMLLESWQRDALLRYDFIDAYWTRRQRDVLHWLKLRFTVKHW